MFWFYDSTDPLLFWVCLLFGVVAAHSCFKLQWLYLVRIEISKWHTYSWYTSSGGRLLYQALRLLLLNSSVISWQAHEFHINGVGNMFNSICLLFMPWNLSDCLKVFLKTHQLIQMLKQAFVSAEQGNAKWTLSPVCCSAAATNLFFSLLTVAAYVNFIQMHLWWHVMSTFVKRVLSIVTECSLLWKLLSFSLIL